ncbi:MAG: cyclic nucleotide-binding domain-containing protein, partial [Terrimonas sp.]|nr:cyclic nucleotide-binding domain-containing protein [Terrimonas sp.]
MTNDLILSNVAKHITLEKSEVNYFISLLVSKKIPRKTVLLKEGYVCNYLNYVHSGILRAYHIDKEGKESTIMFAVSDWWVTDMYCFLNHKPA